VNRCLIYSSSIAVHPFLLENMHSFAPLASRSLPSSIFCGLFRTIVTVETCRICSPTLKWPEFPRNERSDDHGASGKFHSRPLLGERWNKVRLCPWPGSLLQFLQSGWAIATLWGLSEQYGNGCILIEQNMLLATGTIVN
jgi:hypothetical protein